MHLAAQLDAVFEDEKMIRVEGPDGGSREPVGVPIGRVEIEQGAEKMAEGETV